MQNPLKNFPPEMLRDLKVRLVLLCVFGVSMALAWWSINRLPASEKKLDRQNLKITELEDQITGFERRWDPKEAEQMNGRFKETQKQLFGGQQEFASWQAELKRQASQLTVSVNTSVSKTQECPLPGKRFAITSAMVEVRPSAPGVRTNSPYLRLLSFAQNLSSQNKRVDLIELKASGSSNSVSEAHLALQLWSLENSP